MKTKNIVIRSLILTTLLLLVHYWGEPISSFQSFLRVLAIYFSGSVLTSFLTVWIEQKYSNSPEK